MPTTNWLSTADLAETMGISVAALRARLKRNPSGLPPAFRAGRGIMFDPVDVDEWLRDRKAEERRRVAATRTRGATEAG